MGINVNDKTIKKVIVDDKVESSFPKRKDGKNDRVAMVEGLEHGHKYYLTATFIYGNWDEYTTTLTVEKILNNREYVQVVDSGEGRFGTFCMLFNSLLSGSFKNDAQMRSDWYFSQLEKFNGMANEKIKQAQNDVKQAQYKQRKAEQEKNDAYGKYAKECVDHENTRGELNKSIRIIGEKENEIMVLTEKLTNVSNAFDQNYASMLSRKIMQLVRIQTAKGKNDMEIALMINQLLNSYMKELTK